MLSIFSCACSSLCLLWRKISLDILPLFGLGCLFFLLLSCMSCLYILEIKLLSVTLFANIFSYSEGCLFILSIISFAVQKPVSLIWSHLFIFVFISVALWDSPKKTSVQFMSDSVFPMFSSRSFIVSCLVFKSLSCSEFIFGYGEWVCSNFLELHVAFQLSQHHLLKRVSFLHCHFCLLCQKRINDPRCVSLYLDSLFCSFNPYVCFCASTMLSWLL